MIIPVILSGGSGTRLWPLSRKQKPKQFLFLQGSHTLFQSTLLRCNDALFDGRPIIVAADDHRFLVAENLSALSSDADVLLEPVARNSCPAIVAACLQAEQRESDAIVVVLAADHLVEDTKSFAETIRNAVPACEAGYLVTFGVKPEFPSSGYGYIKPGKPAENTEDRALLVDRFVEKPDSETAEQYVSNGYLWNSGNFMFRAKAFLKEARNLAPDLVGAVTKAFENRVEDLGFLRLEQKPFEQAMPISVDYAIMEKTSDAVVIPALHDWSDIGTWESVWKNTPGDEKQNVMFGDALVMSGKRNLVHSPERLTSLIGVDDLAVVTTPDAVLIARRDHSEDISKLVTELDNAGRSEATMSRKTYRPWGNYDVIDGGNNFKVKRLEIKPNATLSLQRHKHRAEHWVVVSGSPEVTIGEKTFRLLPNQSTYIPKGEVHRLSNPGEETAILIEVQTGEYLEEDDIERLEDVYNRPISE